jgi:hypothetical protein
MGWLSAIGQMGSEYGQAKQNVAKEKRTNQREDLDDALAVFRAQLDQRRVEAETKRAEAAQAFNERKLKDTENYHKKATNPVEWARKQAAIRATGDPEAEWDDLDPQQQTASAGYVDRLSNAAPIGSQSKVKVADPNSPTGFSWAWYDTINHKMAGDLTPGAPAQADPNAPTARAVWKLVPQPDGSSKPERFIEESVKGADAVAALAGGKTPQTPAGASAMPVTTPRATGGVTARPVPGGASPSAVAAPGATVPAYRKTTTLGDEDYKTAAWAMQHGGTYADVTKGMKQGSVQGFNDYLKRHNIPIPAKGASAMGSDAVAGLDILESTMFKDSIGENKAPVLSLKSTLGALDSSSMTLTTIWPMLQKYVGGTKPASIIEANTLHAALKYLKSSDPMAYQYVTAMQQAVSTINGLRKYMGNPRYTEALAKRFISELPDPVKQRQGC